MGDSSNKSENIWKKGVAHVIETRFVKGIFLIRELPAHNHDRALSK